MKKIAVFALAALVAATALMSPAQAQEAKNVILMISDGIGFNGWEAAKYYQGSLPYDNDDFNFYGMTTYMYNVYDNTTGTMLNSDLSQVKGQDAADHDWTGVPQGYDKDAMWTDFEYHRNNGSYNGFTDSAAAATAMYTGEKTYNSAVSYGVDGYHLKTIAEYAAEMGKATGAVSSVQLNHATPAAVDAHNNYRSNYGDIADEMINSDLDVIMGGSSHVGPNWVNDAIANGFTVIDDSDLSQWDDLIDGTLAPSKVAGIFGGSTLDGRAKPTLEEMTKGSLNVLSQDADGFFLMVEGGAVDWNNHDNNIDLMLREQIDFDNSVEAVIDWIETSGGGWEENTLIITSDHECGAIWGPGSGIDDNGTPGDPSDDIHTFNNVVDNGVGVLPGAEYYSGAHTNALVPLWTRGVGANMFDQYVDGQDTVAAGFWTQFGGSNGWDGSYVDNTDIFQVMARASGAIPEPSSIAILGLLIPAAGFFARRRRKA